MLLLTDGEMVSQKPHSRASPAWSGEQHGTPHGFACWFEKATRAAAQQTICSITTQQHTPGGNFRTWARRTPMLMFKNRSSLKSCASSQSRRVMVQDRNKQRGRSTCTPRLQDCRTSRLQSESHTQSRHKHPRWTERTQRPREDRQKALACPTDEPRHDATSDIVA
eukprot:316649-Chlamydomonas_euryale.AAC.3